MNPHPEWHYDIAESITEQMLEMDFPELDHAERGTIQSHYMAWIVVALQAYDALLSYCLPTDPSCN